MTYFTSDSAPVSPTTSEKRSRAPPRRNALRSASFPRLRSWPIHSRSCGFQRRGRWKRKKRLPSMSPSAPSVGLPYFRFSPSIPCPATVNSGLVAGQRFLGRVLVIGQQREMQVVVPIGQEAHFEGLDQAFDVCDTCQHRRNHDQRARLRRKPVREVHSRQCPRRDQEHRQPVHYRHRQLAGGEQREDSKRPPRARRPRRRHGPSPATPRSGSR